MATTGLNRSTVGDLVSELVEVGLVRESAGISVPSAPSVAQTRRTCSRGAGRAECTWRWSTVDCAA
ncbi:MAG: hypothetical protein ACKOFP_06250 [Actinomycetota bacterium]